MLAEVLHRSECGHQVLRLLISRLAARIAKEFPELAIDLCEAREGDIALVNSQQTFAKGNVFQRPPKFNVMVLTEDGDLYTQLPMRPVGEVFLHSLWGERRASF